MNNSAVVRTCFPQQGLRQGAVLFPMQTKGKRHHLKSEARSLGCVPAVSPRGSLLPRRLSSARVTFRVQAAVGDAAHGAVREGGKTSMTEDDLGNATASA